MNLVGEKYVNYKNIFHLLHISNCTSFVYSNLPDDGNMESLCLVKNLILDVPARANNKTFASFSALEMTT